MEGVMVNLSGREGGRMQWQTLRRPPKEALTTEAYAFPTPNFHITQTHKLNLYISLSWHVRKSTKPVNKGTRTMITAVLKTQDSRLRCAPQSMEAAALLSRTLQHTFSASLVLTAGSEEWEGEATDRWKLANRVEGAILFFSHCVGRLLHLCGCPVCRLPSLKQPSDRKCLLIPTYFYTHISIPLGTANRRI